MALDPAPLVTPPVTPPVTPVPDDVAQPPPRADLAASEVSAAGLAFTSYLRVVAVCAVVLIHTAGLTYRNQALRSTDAWWVASAATFSTKWAVPAFVMVSGALLLRPPAQRSISVFYRRRLARIGIPLAAWHLVYITLTATVLVTTAKPRDLIARFLRGESYTGLYFFWLILGLYLITPLLWPMIETMSTRTIAVAGVLLVAAAALNQSLRQVINWLQDGSSPVGDPSLVTQFVPYLGFFLLGYALRDVVVRGRARVLALAALTTGLCLELTWQVTRVFAARAAGWLNLLAPVHYQGWVLGAAAIAVFLLTHAIVHPQSRWARPAAARRARAAGDLTLGVYAIHPLVLILLLRVPCHQWPSGAKTLTQLVALCAATLLGALALTLVLRRVPWLNRTV